MNVKEEENSVDKRAAESSAPSIAEATASRATSRSSTSTWAPAGMAGITADFSRFSFMESHKIKQSTPAQSIPYTVERGIRAVSIPAGLAQRQEILIPELSHQRIAEVKSIEMAPTIQSLAEGLKVYDDPSIQHESMISLIKQLTGPSTAFRFHAIREMQVSEGGRTLMPCFKVNGIQEGPFNIAESTGKCSPETVAAVEKYIARWSQQYAVFTDTAIVQAAAGRAMADAVIAHIISAVCPGTTVKYIDPTSVISGDAFKPKWISVKPKHDKDVLKKMLKVQNLILAQVSRQLATMPDREKFTSEEAQHLFAADILTMHADILTRKYGNTLHVYCGGFINKPALDEVPDQGTQIFLRDFAACIKHLYALIVETKTTVTSMGFEDPEAPEPYFADQLKRVLNFATLLDQYLEWDPSHVYKRTAIGSHVYGKSARDRYSLRMRLEYAKQTYVQGTMYVGNTATRVIIPAYGLAQMAGLDIKVNAGDKDTLALEIEGLISCCEEAFDAYDYKAMPVRSTESPLSLCVVETVVISPYILGTLVNDSVKVSKAAKHFDMATEIFRTMITSSTYLGNGFAPYRSNFNNHEIFTDTSMYLFDDHLHQYLDEIGVEFADGSVLLPMGMESVRSGGLTLENVMTFYSVKPTNHPEELTMSGDMVLFWSQELADLLTYEAHPVIPQTNASMSSR